MKINYDFILKHLGLQGIEVTYTNVNNGTFEIFAVSTQNFAVCPRCKRITQQVHDSRCHPFDEPFTFIRKYQRHTIPYEKYVFTLMHKNTIKNIADILDHSEHTC